MPLSDITVTAVEGRLFSCLFSSETFGVRSMVCGTFAASGGWTVLSMLKLQKQQISQSSQTLSPVLQRSGSCPAGSLALPAQTESAVRWWSFHFCNRHASYRFNICMQVQCTRSKDVFAIWTCDYLNARAANLSAHLLVSIQSPVARLLAPWLLFIESSKGRAVL